MEELLLLYAATDNKNYVAPVNETDNVIFLPFNDEQALEDCFEENGNEISSVIVEGIQGVGGINVADEEFFEKDQAAYVMNIMPFILPIVFNADMEEAGKFFQS